MAHSQKRTYLAYSRGFLPEQLPLGSLFVDPANPLGHERKRWRSTLSTSQLDDWAIGEGKEEAISLEVHATREWLAGASILHAFRGKIDRKGFVDIQLTGDSGRRLQLDRPETFLNEVILKEPTARTWIADQLSICHQMSFVQRICGRFVKTPKIWMVTGVQYVTNARVSDTSSKSLTSSLTGSIPIPEPVAATAAIPTVSIKASYTNKDVSKCGALHPNEKIWAAQFSALDVKYIRGMEESANVLLDQLIPIHEPMDQGLNGIRGSMYQPTNNAEIGSDMSAVVRGLERDRAVEDLSADSMLDEVLDADWDLFDRFVGKDS
ncbi:hypothetical protein M426DRAFT_317408 [Hypoxylon sp. CI-4A]|nr:hypothetical protein M426DRAFT_317408 [Hypoxylon sp. CI-4A]